MVHGDCFDCRQKLTNVDLENDRLKQEVERLNIENRKLQRMCETAQPARNDGALRDFGNGQNNWNRVQSLDPRTTPEKIQTNMVTFVEFHRVSDKIL